MPKNKISEYSTTNSANTDIESINIDEGCPPSSINNAIRELMVHLKEFQTGSSGDPLTVAGGMFISGGGSANTLTVTGILTASGGTILSSTNTLSGSNIISGNINSSGTTNTFSGGNILSGTNTISGSAIISGNINSSGSANTFSGGVVYSGTNTFSSSLIISGNINSSGTTNTFSGGNIFSGTNTMSGSTVFSSGNLKLAGSSSGTATLNAPAAASTNTYTLPPDTSTLGYRNVPAVGTKTGSYTLATTDVGEYVQVGSGGSITIPDATFAEGDVISIFNNTASGVTITCTITTAYIAGTDSDKATVTLATRGVCTVLFISSTVCVITGNVS